jgi:hypothetical protein
LAANRTWTLSLPQNIHTAATPTFGQLTLNAAGSATTAQLALSGTTNNWIGFNTNGVGAPTFTNRSGGTKIVLYPEVAASSADYALGIEGSTLWSSVPTTSGQFRWYGGITQLMGLFGDGTLSLSRDSATLTFASATGTKNITTGGTSNLTISPGGTTTVIGNRLNSILTIQNNGTFSGGSGAGSNLRVEYGNILIARIGNTGTGQRDAILQLLDENVVKTNIAANASRGGVTYFDNGGNFLIGKSTENGANARLQVNGYVQGGAASTTGLPNVTGVTTQIAFEARGTGAGSHPSICYHKEGEYTMYLQGQTTSRGLRLYAAGGETIANLFVQGDVFAYSSSDIRLKDNIQFIKNPIEKLFKIGGYSFKWNNLQDAQSGNDYGVIAQEIEAVFPELVQTRENGYKAVKYEKLVPVLIEAVKEQTRIIEQQQNQIDELREMVNKILNK